MMIIDHCLWPDASSGTGSALQYIAVHSAVQCSTVQYSTLHYRCIFGHGQCKISRHNRTNCKLCRYRRCLEVGMKPEKVRAVMMMIVMIVMMVMMIRLTTTSTSGGSGTRRGRGATPSPGRSSPSSSPTGTTSYPEVQSLLLQLPMYLYIYYLRAQQAPL